MLEVHALFSGRVQGVGFRFRCSKEAIKLGLTGTVQNLSNGKVELIVQGEKEKIESLLSFLKQIFPDSAVLEKKESNLNQKTYSSFTVI